MRPSWLAVALAISAALNLFLIGLMAGVFLLGDGARDGARRGPPLWRMGANLDETHRQAFQGQLRRAARGALPEVLEARAARRDAYDALSREPFDRAAAGQAFARARALDNASRSRVDEAVLDFAATLPSDQRAALAEGYRREGPRGHRRWREDRGPPTPPAPP